MSHVRPGSQVYCELVGLPLCDLGAKGLAEYIEVLGAGGLQWKRGRGGKRMCRKQAWRWREQLQTHGGEGLSLHVEVERREPGPDTRAKIS